MSAISLPAQEQSKGRPPWKGAHYLGNYDVSHLIDTEDEDGSPGRGTHCGCKDHSVLKKCRLTCTCVHTCTHNRAASHLINTEDEDGSSGRGTHCGCKDQNVLAGMCKRTHEHA
eukprot:scaffold206906_cov21-Tisochrysis_lutea.AAC.1